MGRKAGKINTKSVTKEVDTEEVDTKEVAKGVNHPNINGTEKVTIIGCKSNYLKEGKEYLVTAIAAKRLVNQGQATYK